MGAVKSDNRHLAALVGYEGRWLHSGAAETKTITPHGTEPIILHRIVVNTTTASAIIVRDSAVGVIATLKASVSEGTYVYAVKLKGNLIVENPGGSDITIVFSNY